MNTTDELMITDVDLGGPNPGEELRLQIRWQSETGDAMQYLVNGRRVPGDVYDRILATVRARSLFEVSGILDPDNEHGITQVLDRIHDAINEDENGKHRTSLVEAIVASSE